MQEHWQSKLLADDAREDARKMPPPLPVPSLCASSQMDKQSKLLADDAREDARKMPPPSPVPSLCASSQMDKQENWSKPTRPVLSSFSPKRKRRSTFAKNQKGLTVVKRRPHRRYSNTLNTWQKTFLQFLTQPATHRYLRTGRPIPRKNLAIWGRQNTFRIQKSELPPTMIRMNSVACISFADESKTTKLGEWIQDQRHLNKTSDPVTSSSILHQEISPDIVLSEVTMENQYKQMEQSFRSELLRMVGVDLAKTDKPSIVDITIE